MRQNIVFLFSLPLLFLFTLSFPRQVAAYGCGAPVPSTPSNVKAVSGPKSGEVTLFWDEAAHANRYAVAYGLESNNYIYGADTIGGESARSYTVSLLRPGVRYYFRLAAARNCSSSAFSSEVSAIAAGGATEQVAFEPQPKIGAPELTTPVAPVSQVVRPPLGGVGRLNLKAVSGPKSGQVALSWQHADSADNYHLMYGRSMAAEEFGALNLGRVDSFTVSHLVPGQAYYFALVPIFNNQPLYTSNWVKAYAKQAVQVIQTTPEALGQPKKGEAETSTKKSTTSKESTVKEPSPSPSPKTEPESEPTTPAGQ